MRVIETILGELRRRSPSEASGFRAADEHWSVACDVEQTDSLGCSLRQVEIQRKSGLAPSPSSAAAALCRRVTYLLEPLSVIEIDSPRARVLVRSTTPHRRDGAISYFEAVMADGTFTLNRYQKEAESTSRQPIAFVLTYEQLETLIEDVSASGTQSEA